MMMRIPLTTILITTERAVAVEAAAQARAQAETHAAGLMKRWARNPYCLRAAMAAHAGVSARFVLEHSPSLVRPMIRAIEAFADEMACQRGEPDNPAPPDWAGDASRFQIEGRPVEVAE